MRTKQRNFAMSIIGFIMAIAMVLGFTSLTAKPVQGSASTGAPTITMVSGASARFNADHPGIKFTAVVDNHNSDYRYGMLILPEKAFANINAEEFVGRYHAYFVEKGITNYADKRCSVYEEDGRDIISLALTDIHDFTMGFVGIAYTLDKEGNYTYADVNMVDNARSIAYVAQVALKNESGLSDDKISILEDFLKGDYIIESEDHLNNDNLTNTGTVIPADYAMKYIFNAAGEAVSQITDKAYAGGTKVSFKYYIPKGTVTSWWGIAWNTDASKANIYHAADKTSANYVGHTALSATVGSWTNVEFTLPEGGPYYLYFGSEVGAAHGRWMIDGQNSYALIDDFTIGSTTETFASADLNDSIFTVLNAAGVDTHMLKDVEYVFSTEGEEEEETPDYSNEIAMQIMFNNGDDGVRAITKEAYAGGSLVEFKYFIQADTKTEWWGLAWHTDASKANNYHAAGIENPVGYKAIDPVVGQWVSVSVTLPSGGPYYLYFGFNCGAWQDSSGAPYILIDNFTVNGETETFNDGIENSSWDIRQPELTFNSASGKGYISLQGEFAAELDFSASFDCVSTTFMTKQAVAKGGDTVTLQFYIPESTTVGTWWFIGWSTANTKDGASYWVPNKVQTVNGGLGLSTSKKGEWVTATVTIPTDSEGYTYYLYVCGYCGDGKNWSGPVYMDNIEVSRNGSVVVFEDFNNGVEESIFSFNASYVSTSEDGEGCIVEEPVVDDTDYMLGFNAEAIGGHERIAMITGASYLMTSEITFKAMWTGNATSDRWGLSYTTKPDTLDYYTPKLGNLKQDAGVVYTYKFTFTTTTYTVKYSTNGVDFHDLTSGSYSQGKNYFYFAVCPAVKGSGAAFYIDDFTITHNAGTGVDTFANKTSTLLVESSTLNANNGSTGMCYAESEMVEEEVFGEYAAKLDFTTNVDSFKADHFISREAIVQAGDVVTFKYMIPSTTTAGDWWAVCWAPDKGYWQPSGYTTGSLDKIADGIWRTKSITITGEAGAYYQIYFCVYQNWNGPIYIDDFTVTRGGAEVVYEDFNHGINNSIFSANPVFVSNSEEGEGYVYVEPTFPGDYAAKIYAGSLKGGLAGFVTKDAYPAGSTVFLRSFIPSGDFAGWWSVAYTTDPTNVSMYNNKLGDLSTTRDQWRDRTFTLPTTGGPYYILIVGATGENPTKHGFIDNVKITTPEGVIYYENFSNGLEDSLFNANDSTAVMLSADGEGCDILDYAEPGEYAAKITIDLISSTASTPSFITKQKYVSDGTLVVTFDYFMSGNTISKWWAFFWTNDNTVADIYAHVGNNKENNSGIDLPTGVQDQWAKASVTIPAGEWYFYIAGAVGEWGKQDGEEGRGYVIIDNFQIGNIVTETFNNTNNANSAKDYGIFVDNREAKHADAVTLVDGKKDAEEPTPEEPEEPTPEEPEAPAVAPNTVADLIAKGEIVNFLENAELGSIFNNRAEAISPEGIPESVLFIEGSFHYAVTGAKEFAIYFGNGQYVVVDADSIAFYIGTTLIRENIVEDGENDLYLAITAGGRVVVILDGVSYGLGNLTEEIVAVSIVALGGVGDAIISNINVIAYKCVASDIPYFGEGVIDFSAYAFDSEAMVSDAGFALLAEAGFTKSLPLLQGRVGGLNGMYGDSNYKSSEVYNTYPTQDEVNRLMAEVNADAIKALDLAQKYGMQHYVFNEVLYNLERHTRWNDWLDEIVAASTYLNHPALAGHVFVDEPSSSEMTKTITAYNAYVAAYGRTDAYTNLLPRNAAEFILDSYYVSYIQNYVTNIATGTNGSGFVSYDQYPLKTTGIESNHLRNFEVVAEQCRDNNLEFRYLLKASVTGDSGRSLRATQSVNDLYVQIYSALCFGVEEIGYYQFTDHTKTDGTAGDAVISGYSLEKTDVYEWAKQANNEVHAFENAYMSYAWKSVSVFGKSITQTNNLKNKASAYGYISNVTVADSSKTVLVGNFDDADGRYTYGAKNAYMVMNYGNTNGATTATTGVTITFNGTPARVLVYQGGKVSVVTLDSNALTLDLMIGEGAFVIPLTNNK